MNNRKPDIITVLLADDHPAIRRLLSEFLNEYEDIQVIGEAKTGAEAIEKAVQLAPRIVLMDVRLPDMDGAQAVLAILKENPNIKIIGLSAHSAQEVAAKMEKAGASAFMSKDKGPDEMHQIICDVANNLA